MSLRRKLLGTLTGLSLYALAGSPVSGQSRVMRLQFEAGAGMIIPTRALSPGQPGWTRSKAAPLITGGVILRRGSILAFRMRGGAALTAGTVSLIRSGGAGKAGNSNGRTLLALGEVLIAFRDRPAAELAVGIGARRHHFGQENCARPCGGDRSDTVLTGSLSISLGTKLGGVNVGLAAGSLVSSYRGRAMLDLLLGARARF